MIVFLYLSFFVNLDTVAVVAADDQPKRSESLGSAIKLPPRKIPSSALYKLVLVFLEPTKLACYEIPRK